MARWALRHSMARDSAFEPIPLAVATVHIPQPGVAFGCKVVLGVVAENGSS
jgi:hypothetical protein